MNSEDQRTVEFQESGAGVTVVFVPGSFSTGASWRAISTPMSERYHVITTSLCGYGKTLERRVSGGDGFMAAEMDALEAVLEKAGKPVHLVAHSFGAWVALNLAMYRKPKFLSLTLLEPTVFNLLDEAGESGLNDIVRTVVAQYMSDWNRGEKQAVHHIINFYGGPGTFESFPPAIQDKLSSQTPTNILDWQTGNAVQAERADFAQLDVPISIICGALSHDAMKRSNGVLASYLPRATLSFLDNANHFMIGTHAAELLEVIEWHIAQAQLPPQSPSIPGTPLSVAARIRLVPNGT